MYRRNQIWSRLLILACSMVMTFALAGNAQESPSGGGAAAKVEGLAPGAPAATPATPPQIDKGDTAWILTSSALVLMMTIPGLFLFYGGLVRSKNVLGTIMQSFVITALISIQWVLFGYSLAFGPDVGGIVGSLAWFG